MQVFDVYTYNLKQVRFKDNKEHLDCLLSEAGLSYTDVGFCFCQDWDGSTCDKAIKLFSNLSEYKKQVCTESGSYPRGYSFSSMSADENGKINLHMDRSHIDDLGGLLKKIPRPINFSFMGVMLDNIDWGDGESHPCVKNVSKETVLAYDHGFRTYYNNGIRFIKEYDYGNKINIINVVIERKANIERLSPLPQGFMDFCAKLGKPIAKARECFFSDEENTKWASATKAMKSSINKKQYDQLFVGAKKDSFKIDQGTAIEAYDLLTPIQGFSPKNILTDVAKKHKYRYKSCINGCYELTKVNAYNHTITVSLFVKPLSAFVSADITVSGYNFNLLLAFFPEIVADVESKLEDYTKKVFEIADEIEKKYADRLYEYYGRTPDWYNA